MLERIVPSTYQRFRPRETAVLGWIHCILRESRSLGYLRDVHQTQVVFSLRLMNMVISIIAPVRSTFLLRGQGAHRYPAELDYAWLIVCDLPDMLLPRD